MPQVAEQCMASWKHYMPDYQWCKWDETTFDIDSTAYTREAYAARKYAFVSDYVRLYALEKEGGIYLDVDFEVYKSFDSLLHLHAFAGIEGSKHKPVMMGVCASEAHGEWVTEMQEAYRDRHFLNPDGTMDLTTNVQYITAIMAKHGFRQDGTEQEYKDLHIFPTDYFSPRQTTGEYLRTDNTYCEHKGISSWNDEVPGWKDWVLKWLPQKLQTQLIKLKRKLIG